MIERDFIKRLIQQLAQVLAEILFYKKKKDWQKVQMIIDVAGKQLLGLNPELRDDLDAATLIELFTYDENTDTEKCLTLAMLLVEQAVLLKNTLNDENLVLNTLEKAAIIFSVAFENKELITKDNSNSVEFCCDELLEYKIENPLLLKILDLYQATGKLSKAEDVLFRLKDNNYENTFSVAQRFYKTVLQMDEKTLKKGNLPREEILEGIKHFQNMS